MNTVLLWVPGWGEMLVIVLFILIFFGAKKIPEIARGMGKGIREFKDATKEIKNEINEGANAANPTSTSSNSENKA
jgi:sec-independent protein translocase protein TatA